MLGTLRRWVNHGHSALNRVATASLLALSVPAYSVPAAGQVKRFILAHGIEQVLLVSIGPRMRSI
jgi:hypothetical protein